MFPKTVDVVEIVFRQVLSNHVHVKIDNAVEARIHADVTAALHILFGDFADKVRITHDSFKSVLEVDFNSEDPYGVWVEFDWDSSEVFRGFL